MPLSIHRASVVLSLTVLLASRDTPRAHQQPVESSAAGEIRGRVLDTAGGALAGAEVTLMLFGQEPRAIGRWTTQTSVSGEFFFKNLEPGRYRVVAHKEGFARRTFHSSSPFDPGRDLDLESGQAISAIDVVLPAAGAIRGRILSEEGRPVTGARVMAELRTREGRLLGVQQPSVTQASGEYEITGLEGGNYFVSVVASRLRAMMGQPVGREIDEYVKTWYPGVIEESKAESVRVEAGRAASGIDVQLRWSPISVANWRTCGRTGYFRWRPAEARARAQGGHASGR